MSSTGIEPALINLLAVFIIAAGVGTFVAKIGKFPYTIALLVAGFLASLAGVEIGIELTHDIILLVLLPPLLFQGAATTDLDAFRENFSVILLMAVVGLAISILVVAAGAHYLFGFQWLIALLFASIILPTDPVSVLALFEELGAPERLSVLVEGESLINDGVAVVVFTTFLALIESDATVDSLLTAPAFGEFLVDIGVTSVGGAIVGLLAGYFVYSVMANLDEHMTEIVLTAILAYGSFLLAEHYIGVSGVIATVVAGLFIGNRGAEDAMSARTKVSVFNTWETAAFVVNTFIFVLIGVKTPIRDIAANAELLAPAIVLVLVGRAVAVYPLVGIANRLLPTDVSIPYQHILVWGGLHASIPIALVLGLPEAVGQREELRVLVFGIAAFSLVVQGLTMGRLIDYLGVVTTTEEEELYQLLIGRARAVDEALEAAEEMRRAGEVPDSVYERFETEYGREKEQLNAAISRLLAEHPEIRDREQIVGERQVLTRERGAIMDAERNGIIGTDVADRLLREVNLKLSQVRDGQTTVRSDPEEEGYEEFWRTRAREHGLLSPEEEPSED